MAKVTSRLQVEVPKEIADQFGIRPGDEVEFVPSDRSFRIVLPSEKRGYDVEDRLRIFDQATQRQREREQRQPFDPASERGWRREDLYDLGLPD